jgi:protein-S-isoprenylcysteine O-methyltransferase Ste14
MSGDDPDKAQVIALPPLIVAAALALGLLFHFLWPLRFLSRTEALWLGGLLIAVSIAIGLGAVSQLVKAKTALDVRKPTMEIVTRGVYRLSRNPIYLSMILLLLGIALCVDSLWILLFAIPLAVILQKGVIEPEERYLEQKFGEKYLRYKATVRRWI